MSIVMCPIHGTQPGERVSTALLESFQRGVDIADDIRDFAFVMEDYECSFFDLANEANDIRETFDQGVFSVGTEERLNVLLCRMRMMCLACLKASLKGRPLPHRLASWASGN
jgi:hypothetical protein